MPAVNALLRGQVNAVCTRWSRVHSGSTSSSRVAAVTVCTTTRTERCCGTVRHGLPLSPTSTSAHGTAYMPVIVTPMIAGIGR